MICYKINNKDEKILNSHPHHYHHKSSVFLIITMYIRFIHSVHMFYNPHKYHIIIYNENLLDAFLNCLDC